MSTTHDTPINEAPRPAGSSRAPATFTAGTMLGVYRIDALLGVGGMGEVFRAVDTRLGRRVALKTCTAHLGERFEREGHTLSALNHPHICTLFDVGPNYLVMELIDGETLLAHIARGVLPLEQAARYGAEIADALAEAHANGIVHRDLKPQNIMLTRHGVKVLDFGIAKLLNEPALTQTGALIGTAAYLAPEQLAGEQATARSDLYALGVVLHEMVTGRRPVPGAVAGMRSTESARAATHGGSTEWSAFEELVRSLLRPDPMQRPGSAAEVCERLRAIATASKHVRSLQWPLAIAAAVIVAVGASSWWALRTSAESTPFEVVRLTPFTPLPGPKQDPAFSPNGDAIAFVWDGIDGASPGIYVVGTTGGEPTRLTSDATDISPAWAPDGRRVAFLRTRPGQANELMIVEMPESGAAPTETKVRDVRQPEVVTRTRRPVLAWAGNEALALPLPDAESGLTSLYRIALDGSAPRRIIASRGGLGDTTPAISADGRWLAYTAFDAGSSGLYIVRLNAEGTADGERKQIATAASAVSLQWSPDAESLLWADAAQLQEWRRRGIVTTAYVASDPFQAFTAHWENDTSLSIVFANRGVAAELQELPLERDGQAPAGPSVAMLRIAGTQRNPALSPDGRWLAFSAAGANGQVEAWLAGPRGESPRSTTIAVTSPMGWSRDSRHIAFKGGDTAVSQLYVLDVDDTGSVTARRQITNSPFSLFTPEWSADGKHVYTTGNRSPAAQRLVRVPAAGGDIEDLFEGTSPKISVDGKRIYYGKSLQAGIFERSLEGDIASNPEQRVLEDYVPPRGFTVGEKGIFYVGRDQARNPVSIRFFDFALQRSFDLAPPPDTPTPVLSVSPDGTRLIFEKISSISPDLRRMDLRRGP